MTVEVKILEDSITEPNKIEDKGIRLTTFEIRYPRFFHADFMTHRVFSRNASSSRAMPASKLIESGFRDMAMPLYWGINRPGMQAKQEATGFKKWLMKTTWILSGYSALSFAWIMSKLNVHKQIVNRIIEPWTHIKVVVTATEWENFFNLRNHPDAQPELQVLANKMQEAYNTNVPKVLKKGEWHLPYISDEEKATNSITDLVKISTARCARTSYHLYDGNVSTIDKDLALYERLVGSEPIHASPTEHQATPDERYNSDFSWKNAYLHGNFKGWVQHRKLIEKEYSVEGKYF